MFRESAKERLSVIVATVELRQTVIICGCCATTVAGKYISLYVLGEHKGLRTGSKRFVFAYINRKRGKGLNESKRFRSGLHCFEPRIRFWFRREVIYVV